jgi:hypothetical protein
MRRHTYYIISYSLCKGQSFGGLAVSDHRRRDVHTRAVESERERPSPETRETQRGAQTTIAHRQIDAAASGNAGARGRHWMKRKARGEGRTAR